MVVMVDTLWADTLNPFHDCLPVSITFENNILQLHLPFCHQQPDLVLHLPIVKSICDNMRAQLCSSGNEKGKASFPACKHAQLT